VKASRIFDACAANWPKGWVGCSGQKAVSHSRAAQDQGLPLETQRRIHTVLWRG